MLESCAANMEADGIGAHSALGHAAVLCRMASCMRAEAAAGKMPHAWHDQDYPTTASATGKTSIESEVLRAVQAAVEPLQDELRATNSKIAASEAKMKDLSDKARARAAAPDRGTPSPIMVSLLERGGTAGTIQRKH
jgi:hypothetical protein